MRSTHLRKPFLLLILAALALPACTLQARTSVSPDGSGRLTAEINPEVDGLAELAALNLDLATVCSPVIAASVNLPPDTTYSLEAREGANWCLVDIPFTSLAALQGVLASSIPAIQVNTLSLEDKRFLYDISLDLSRRVEIDGIKLPPLTLSWTLEVPGQLTGHNADRVEGNLLNWQLKPGEFRTLRAESTTGSGGLPAGGLRGLATRALAFVCLGSLGVGALVGGLWTLLRRRRGRRKT